MKCRSECVSVVEAVELLVAFGDETGLVLENVAVDITFDLEDPAAREYVKMRLTRNEGEDVVDLHSIEFIPNGLNPVLCVSRVDRLLIRDGFIRCALFNNMAVHSEIIIFSGIKTMRSSSDTTRTSRDLMRG